MKPERSGGLQVAVFFRFGRPPGRRPGDRRYNGAEGSFFMHGSVLRGHSAELSSARATAFGLLLPSGGVVIVGAKKSA